MRSSAELVLASVVASIVSCAPAFSQTTPACTGLCLQQLPANSCPNGGTTISGAVYAPNGTDPLPNVQVYIPNDVVAAFTPGVQCPVVGALPSGSPLVGATTGVDGTFTITNVPVGTNIPLVIVTGKWRRQIVIPSTTSCADTALTPDQTHLPRNQSEGDIPLFAVATGSVDTVECVLRKVGIADSEFTDPSGGGRIQLYSGSGNPGARVDASTPSQIDLMSNLMTLNQYDVLMLPCQGSQFAQTSTELSNFVSFVNAGGRVYSSHYSYVWMYYPQYTNGPFANVVNWQVNDGSYPNGTATVNTSFAGGLTLSNWLAQPAINASVSQGQMAISTLKHDVAAPNGVIPPTQNWLTLNTTNNPTMQFVFDTPIGATNQCGRVLYNEYHVENPATSPANVNFPNECVSGQAATPQEKLLEFMLFELTDQGGAATLTPAMQDFGQEAISLSTAAIPFTLTNNSTFSINGSQITTSGPFTVLNSNGCTTIAAGASCTINVIFTPTALGAATGTLSANAGATSLLSALTGTGIPDLAFSLSNLTFGSLDVGGSASQSFSVTNTASGVVPVTLPNVTTLTPTATEFGLTTNCPARLGVGASCTATVTFSPTTTGAATGTITDAANGATPASLTGNGIDFTIAAVNKAGATSTSGSVIAGDNVTFYTLTTPLAGFANPLTLSCNSSVPGSTCTVASPSFTPSSAVTSSVAITTTSEYTVIGYTGGVGRPGVLMIVVLASGVLLLVTRRRAPVARWGLLLLMIGATTVGMTGCSGKLPAKNSVYTAPGTYRYTVSATDGFLVHTATYSLTVTAK